MQWIGLTGGIATGKSTAAKVLRESGRAVIDADDLARRAVAPGTEGLGEVVSEFGTNVLLPSGELDRKRLGEATFGHPERLAALERIVHPAVRRLCRMEREALERAGRLLAFYDVPLLFEKDMESEFDFTVAILCSAERQLARLMARNQLNQNEAQMRISSQLPLAEKARRATVTIMNDGSVEDLSRAVLTLADRAERGEFAGSSQP